MICKSCAWEADMASVGIDPLEREILMDLHDDRGHADCVGVGCSCQHHPIKEGQIIK